MRGMEGHISLVCCTHTTVKVSSAPAWSRSENKHSEYSEKWNNYLANPLTVRSYVRCQKSEFINGYFNNEYLVVELQTVNQTFKI